MKKILSLILVLMILMVQIPVPVTYAQHDRGILYGKGSGTNQNQIYALTDGDHSTYHQFGSGLNYYFEPHTITGFYLHHSPMDRAMVYLYDKYGSIVWSSNPPIEPGVNQSFSVPNIENVTRVRIHDYEGSPAGWGNLGNDILVYEFEVYGTPYVDTTPPSRPSLTGERTGENSIRLNWPANTEKDLKEYKIYQNGVLVKTVSKPYTSTTITNLEVNQHYQYQITAVDDSGNESEKSNLWEITLDIPTPQPPVLSGERRSLDSVKLKWTNPPYQYGGVDKFNVYMNGQLIKTVNGIYRATTISKLPLNQTYHFEITTINKYGQESTKSNVWSINLDDKPPNKLPWLKGWAHDSRVTLDWPTGSTLEMTNGEKDFSHYNIYQNGVLILTSKYSYASIKGLENGKQYVYQVSIVDKSGQEGPLSDPILLVPYAGAKGVPATQPDTAPTIDPVTGLPIDYTTEPTPEQAVDDDFAAEPTDPEAEPIPPGEEPTPEPIPPFNPDPIDSGVPYTPPPNYSEFPPGTTTPTGNAGVDPETGEPIPGFDPTTGVIPPAIIVLPEVQHIPLHQGSFRVYVVNVPESIQQVRFQTWTESNGQDDMKWYNGTKGPNGTWMVDIPFNQHGNEPGKYITDVYIQMPDGSIRFVGQSLEYAAYPDNPYIPPIIDCDGCQFLKEMLACPEWETYMGQWEDMLKRVIPPPPDWNEVAQTIAGGMSQGLADAVKQGINDAIGNTPPPTTGDLENMLPAQPDLPSQHPELEQLQPLNPFPDGQPEFNLEDREEIQIIDGSTPYIISDPIENINSHPVRTVITPGDESNHNDGIKNPDKVNSKNHIPVPNVPQSTNYYPTPYQ